ncbi:MAG: DUF4355 domain-containing protein [Bacteroidota bacterium]
MAKLEKGEAITADELNFLKGLKTVNLDSVKEFLEKDEAAKKYLQSLTDAAVTKGIATFKEKTMPGLIEEEIKKKFPDETEEQKKLRLLTEDQAKLKADIKRKDLLAKATSVAIEKKLPLKLVEKFLGDDEETTIKNLELFETEYNGGITAAVEEKFKVNGRTPPTTPLTPPVDYSKMTDDQYYSERLKEQKK